MGPAGVTFAGVLFVLGMVLWHLCDERKKSVVAAEKGEREQPGPPVAIDVLSAVIIVVGLIGVGNAAFATHEDDADDGGEGTNVNIGFGGLTIKSRSKPTSEDRAPWEFEMTFAKAQALQGDAYSSEMGDLYDHDQRNVVGAMDESKIKADGTKGTLGLPAISKGTADLSKFGVESVRFGTWLMNGAEGGFTTAVVRASDGTKTLRFPLRRRQNDSPWGFAVAPVEFR
jgi:hypothetical protein